MRAHDPVNILLVDNRPENLLAYKTMLSELGENLITAGSAREALEKLLHGEVAVVLVDVRMPDVGGFELAATIREHPRFENTAIIFISACYLEDCDRLQGYEAGAVDYITIPVVPELLRAKVKVFAELHRKTRQLEQLNAELEQRAAERTAELAASRQQLQLVADHAPVLLAQCDAEQRYTFVNARYADFFGCRPADIVGRHARDVLGEQAYADAAPHMERALAGHRTEYDLELPHTSQGPRAVRVAYAPEFDACGRAVGWVAAILDITERKQTEAKLARLAAIVESSDDAIISKTLEGRITSWNAGAARIFGYEANEMIGQPITRIIPPELHAEEQKILARLKRGERIEHHETTRIAKDGRPIDMSLTVSPVRNDAGELIGASKVSRDITKHKQAEQARRRSEALASAVYAAALDAVITIDHPGIVMEWNPAAEEIFGYSRSDAVGREMAELIVPPHLREAHRRGLTQYLASGQGPVLRQSFEMPALRGDGTEFPIELSIVPISSEGPPLFTVFARDITERKAAEERQRLLAAELDHRVKNILTRIVGIVERSRASAPSADALAATLSGRLSALARAHARLTRSNWTGSALRELVEEELAPYRSPTNVSLEGPDAVLSPEAGQALGMVFHELATNAAKYGALSASEGQVTVRWQLTGDNDSAQLKVVWQEVGGPSVSVQGRQGFGSRLIRNLLRHELDAQVELSLAPAGVRCEMEIPLRGGRQRSHFPMERQQGLRGKTSMSSHSWASAGNARIAQG
jgi:PAS domain S-box-containing protein